MLHARYRERYEPIQLSSLKKTNVNRLLNLLVTKDHAGKYMVRATNAGGEAQSIADFAVFEPTPDTMVEVHKTVFYEDMKDHRVIQVSFFFFFSSRSCTILLKKLLKQ